MRPVMWMFLGILVTFVLTRSITRFIRARSSRGGPGSAGPIRDIVIGGVHLHHQVLGIISMFASGVVLVAVTPEGVALNVVAAWFGVGTSLTFDEFALWLHLEDVYWSQDGRKSVDAVFCVLLVTGILIGGLDLLSGPPGSGLWWTSVILLAVSLATSVICVLKGKLLTGIVGIIVQPVAWVGAIRLAKPPSWWGRRFYPQRPARARRAHKRFGPAYERRWNRLRDLVAGAPTRA